MSPPLYKCIQKMMEASENIGTPDVEALVKISFNLVGIAIRHPIITLNSLAEFRLLSLELKLCFHCFCSYFHTINLS